MAIGTGVEPAESQTPPEDVFTQNCPDACVTTAWPFSNGGEEVSAMTCK
jgi:hypothetical protein